MSHFTLPKGYEERLSSLIMNRLPEEHPPFSISPRVSLWTKLKPSLYLAASFVGIFIAFKGIQYMKPEANTTSQAQEEIADEDYLRYYEDYATHLVGEETLRELDEVQYL